MSPLKESDSFLYLFNLQSLKNLRISLLHFLRHLDNHLLVYALERFLTSRLLRKQHRFDVYHLQALAFKERIVADLLYVRSDRYFRKLLAAVESLCSDRCYFIGNTLYFDHCRYCHALCILVCPNKTYLCTCFYNLVLAACYGVFCACFWIKQLLCGNHSFLAASAAGIGDLSSRCIGRFSCYLTFTPCMSKCIRFFACFQKLSAVLLCR